MSWWPSSSLVAATALASLLFVCLLSLRSSSAAAVRGRGGRSRAGRTALARRRRRVFGVSAAVFSRLRVSRARDCVLKGRSGSGTVGEGLGG